MVTGEQLRAARALLKLGTRDLAALAGVDKMAVVRAEAGSRKSYVGTIEKLRAALEVAGIVFLPGRDGEYQPTAALRWGISANSDHTEHTGEGAGGQNDDGLSSRAWDEDFEEGGNEMPDEARASLRRYYEEHPDRWAKLSPLGKACLAKAMRLNDTETRA